MRKTFIETLTKLAEKDEKIILTADDWGLVNLYKYPCLKVKKY